MHSTRRNSICRRMSSRAIILMLVLAICCPLTAQGVLVGQTHTSHCRKAQQHHHCSTSTTQHKVMTGAVCGTSQTTPTWPSHSLKCKEIAGLTTSPLHVPPLSFKTISSTPRGHGSSKSPPTSMWWASASVVSHAALMATVWHATFLWWGKTRACFYKTCRFVLC